MRTTLGLPRTDAAAFVSRRVGRRLLERTLRHWEGHGLLTPLKPPLGGRGRFRPTLYRVPDLLAAEVLATLRIEGASLQRVRAAFHTLSELFPDVLAMPGEWRLAVTLSGDVVRFHRCTTDAELVSLVKRPGQLAVFNVGTLAREARAAVREKTRAA